MVFGLGAGGSEIHKPVLEQRPRYCLQHLIRSVVDLDCVVDSGQNGGYCFLLTERKKENFVVF